MDYGLSHLVQSSVLISETHCKSQAVSHVRSGRFAMQNVIDALAGEVAENRNCLDVLGCGSLLIIHCYECIRRDVRITLFLHPY